MKTLKDIQDSPEMKEILKKAEYISSFGSIFEFRLNRRQEPGKTIKLIKYNKQLETTITRYFLKITDLYVYFNNDWSKNDALFNRVKTIPNHWEDSKYEYDTEYSDEKFATKLYYLDIPMDTSKGFNISYWIDNRGIVYRKLDAQDRIEKRVWQINKAGNKTMVFKGKNLAYDTIISYKTDRMLMI